MAYNFHNYVSQNPKGYGPGDILGGIIEGYKAQRMPEQMRQKEELQRRLIEEKMLGNEKTGLENQFLPTKLQQEEQKRGINLKYQEPTLQAALQGSHLSNEAQRMKNDLMERFGVSEAEADLLYKRAQTQKALKDAEYAHLTHLTPEQRLAAEIYGRGTPEYYEHLKRGEGIFPRPQDDQGNEIPLPKGAVNIAGKNSVERRPYEQDMVTRVQKGETAQLANRALDGIERIITRSPKLNRSFSYIAANPADQNAYARAVKGLNEQEQTDLDLLVKYSAQLALWQSENGGQRATNLYRQMVQQIKPGVGMTDAAIREISRGIREENQPIINYADKVAPFIGSSYYVPYQSKNFKGESSKSEKKPYLDNETGETVYMTDEEYAEASKNG